jgi:hypothetical protein
MHFRVNISPYEVDLYTSTIGNINTYTAYVALVMGFSAMMFLTEKKRLVLIWYYLCMVISFFAIIMGSSDNAYLALAALFGLSPFVIFRRHSGIRRYLMMLATFFSVTQCIDWINQIFDGQVVGLDSMFRIIAGYKYLLPFTVLLWVLVIAAWWILEKSSLDERKIGKCCTIVWSVLVFLAIAAVIFVLYDANFAGHAERYNAMKNYLVFDDNWGTKRGYIWKACIRMFRSFPLSHQLFGYGPDTFGILTMKKIHKEMLEVTGFMFDNAHNEYLQDLVTLGVVGLGTYLMFLVTSFWSMCRRGSSDPDSGYLFGILGATVCYSAQAMVNLNLPIVAPMLWLLLSFAMTKKRSGNAAEEA